MEGIDIIKELTDFHLNPDNEAVQAYFVKDNIWKILDIQRYEPSHSAFLVWFFRQDIAQHSQIKALLHLLIAKAKLESPVLLANNRNTTTDMQSFSDAILTGSFFIKTTEVIPELVVNKLSKIKYTDRIDVYIRCSIVLMDKNGMEQDKAIEIILENKVDSNEGKNKLNALDNPTDEEKKYKDLSQTERYYYALSKENNNRKKDNVDYQLFVYLTPKSKPSISSDKYILITYQDLVDNIFENYLKRNDINLYARELVESYLHNLGNPYNKNNKEIIAMTTEERDLLVSFYERNENLFKCMIRAKALNADDDETAKEFEKIEASLKKAGRRRHYTINGEESYTMRGVVQKFIETELNKGVPFDEIKKVIEEKSGAGNKFVGTSKNDVQIGSNKAEPHHFTHNSQTYYVTKELGDKKDSRFYKFRTYVNKNYPNFQIVEISQPQ